MSGKKESRETADSSTSRRSVLKSVGAAAGVAPFAGVVRGLDGTTRGTGPAESGEATRMLFYNTWLFDGVLGGIGASPDTERRADEIGQALASVEYDVAALCEVFTDEQRKSIRSPLEGQGVDARMGPPADIERSSGLYTLLTGSPDERSFVSMHRHEFEADGAEFRDPEAYANKGVLHTEIDLGPGNVDLYSTHLLAGGGLGQVGGFLGGLAGAPPPSEFRSRQVDELIEFVRRTRSPENPTVIVGDFNIGAREEEYATIERMKAELGVLDAWTAYGGRAGATGGGEITEQSKALKEACPIEPSSDQPYYCDDSRESDVGVGRRIDYVFVSEPSDDHAAELDVSDIRRASFWRGLAEPGVFFVDDQQEVPNYLSDHIGLELEFSLEPTDGGGGSSCDRGTHCFQGTVSADSAASRHRRFSASVDGDSGIEVSLDAANDDADLDLYLTLDGRTPSPGDYDRRSITTGSDESISLAADELDAGSVGLAVRAYAGESAFTLSVE